MERDVGIALQGKNPRRRNGDEAAEALTSAKRFVGMISRLPQLRQVLLERRSDGFRIWTVVDGAPFEWSLREPIYQAQLETLKAHPSTAGGLAFRLVNLAEYEEEAVSDLLPADGDVVWPREQAAR